MTTITLTELDDQLVNRVGTHTTDTRLTSAVRLRIINSAIQQVSLEHLWPWLFETATFATVAGQGEYAVPADWMKTDGLTLSTVGIRLINMPFRSIREWPSTSTGRPRVFAVRGQQLHVRPHPEGGTDIIHDYWKFETELALGADTPLIPREYARGVIEWAGHLAMMEIRESDRALEARRSYESWLSRVVDNVAEAEGPFRVRVRPGAEY